jgi:hypothetical protein
MNKNPTTGDTVSEKIDARIKEYDDWRGETLAELRAVVKKALPKVVEEWKWNIPVWSLNGIICTGEVYKAAVKMTFPKGASLEDPEELFNSSLQGNARRAIDFSENEKIRKTALATLLKRAAAANQASKK